MVLQSLLILGLFGTLACAQPRTNVILILADDLGSTDLGCTGNTFHETPHLDKLAAQGRRFSTAYSACTVCSPTRAAILTGQYPARLHITDWISGHVKPYAKLKVPDWQMHLDPKTSSLPKLFKAAGYATASVGKWHLGDEQYYPEKHGFDVNIAGTHKGQPPSYFAPYGIPTLKDGPKGESLNDRLAKEAAAWMATNRDKPFFLYMPLYAVHTPLQARPAIVEKYRKKAEAAGLTKNAVYAALVESMDDTVGMIRKSLEELKLAESTAIIFMSDNGGLLGGGKNVITTNPPFRAGKGSAYEGGVRVPMIVHWPGVTKPGVIDAPIHSIDVLPTLAAMLDLKVPDGTPIDGVSIQGLIANTAKEPGPRPLYWHYPHYHPGGATPYSAVRDHDFKLIEFLESGRVELYNLKDDVGEQKDVSTKDTGRMKALHDQLKQWRERVGAQMPTKNSEFKPNPQEPNGLILLHSREASVHGKTLRYEHQPFKDTLGFWTTADDYATWEFTVFKPGKFEVNILQGCGKGAGGSKAVVILGEQKLEFTVEDTGGFQAFQERTLGTVTIEKLGQFTLELKAISKAKNAVMDCRQIVLKPVR
jgi:arylsulfatase A-like enzyme